MSKDLPPSRTAEQFVVRFPDGMRNRIAEAAKANNRSMNAEIVARLQESFAGRSHPDSTGYARFDPSDLPPPDIYAQLALEAEMRALFFESQKTARGHEELWLISRWRESRFAGQCSAHLEDLLARIAEAEDEIAELQRDIEKERADADDAARYVPDMPGPWARRRGCQADVAGEASAKDSNTKRKKSVKPEQPGRGKPESNSQP